MNRRRAMGNLIYRSPLEEDSRQIKEYKVSVVMERGKEKEAGDQRWRECKREEEKLW